LHKHRVVSLAVSILFTLGVIFSQGALVKAAEVTSSPSIKDISVNKTEAKAGDILTVTVEASAEVSNLAQEANLCYVTGIGENQIEKELTLHLNGDKYTGDIKVNESFAAGVWRPSFVVLQDQEHSAAITYNSRVHTKLGGKFANLFNMDDAEFKVVESVTVPIFKSVSLTNNNVGLYDTVNLSVDTLDEFTSSSLEKEAYACYMLKSGESVIEKDLTLELNGSKYEKNITIDESFMPGKWQLSFIILRTQNGNVEVVYNSQVHENLGKDLSSADINVDEDILGPKLKNISMKIVDEDEMSKVHSYEIRMEAEDDELADKAYISYISKRMNEIKEKYIELTLVGNEYVGTLDIKSSESEGAWELSFIVLNDKQENVTVVYNSAVHEGIGIELNHMAVDEDFKAPGLESIEVIGSDIDDNYKVIVTPSQDVSGLAAEANVCFIAVTNTGEAKLELPLKLVNGKYEGVARFDDKYQNALWKVSFVVLEDNLGNASIIYNNDVHKIGTDLSNGNVLIEGDNTSPVLEYVKLEGKASALFDNVQLSVKATDNGNGLSEEAYVVYTSNEGKEVVEKQLTLKLEDGIYRKAINIDENFAAGNWKISFIVLEDKGGNTGITYNSAVHKGIGTDMSTANIGIEGDNAAPTIKKIMVNADEFKLYDKAEVTVVAEDSGAGLADEASLCYTTRFGGERYLTMKLEGDVYKTSFTIDESFDGFLTYDTWKISFITLQDKEDNTRIVYNNDIHGSIGYDLSDGDININEDISGPEFKNIKVNAESYNLYDNAVITLKAKDSGAGLAEEANVVYVTESGETKGVTLKREKGSYYGTYVGSVVVDESFKGVSWKVDFITLQDVDGNVSIVYNNELHGKIGEELSDGNINIHNDIAAPELKKITMNQDSFKLYDKAIITVEAEDSGSGLSDEANICYATENGDEKFAALKLQDGKYIASITVDDSFKGTSWMVDFITLGDKDGNVNIVYNNKLHGNLGEDLSDGTINISEDIMGPKFTSVKANLNNIEAAGEVSLKINAEDVGAGLAKKANLLYVSDNGKEYEVTLNHSEGGYFGILRGFTEGNWKISFITLEDNDQNVTVVYNSNLHSEVGVDLSAGDVLLGGDVMGPEYGGVSVDQEEYNLYDNGEVTVIAKDNGVGLADEASICYVTDQGDQKFMTMKLENGAYKASFNLDEKFLSRTWKVDFITLEDKAGNVRVVYNMDMHDVLGYNMSRGSIVVKNDIIGPEFKNIEVNAESYNLYDNAVITLKAKDSGSGLAEEANICYATENGDEKFITLKLQDGKYVGSTSVDDSFKGQSWKVDFLTLEDLEGNTRVIYNEEIHGTIGHDLSEGNINITQDIMGPELKTVTVNENDFDLFDNITLTVNASDIGSGLCDEANVMYISDSGKVKEMTLKLQDNKYSATFTVDEEFAAESWRISFIVLKDKEGNVSITYNSNVHSGLGSELSDGDLKAKNDITLPVFEGISISTDLVNQYENLVQVEVKASDDTGLAEKAQLCYVSDLNGKAVEKEAELTLDENGNYVVDVRFDEKDFNGVWRVSFLVIHDTEGNVRIVYNSNVHKGLGTNLSDCNVTADNPEAHIDIQSVSVSESSIVIDESVEITVVPVKGEAELNERASVCYVLRDKDILAERFVELQLVDGVYEGTIEANETADLGQWSISYISIEDQDGNVFAAYNNDVHSIGTDLSAGDFKVEGDIRGELIKDSNGFTNGIDAIVEFKIINYMPTDEDVTLVFEVLDKNSNIINKVESRKTIRSSEGTIVKSRMFIPEEGLFVRAYLRDSEGNELTTIIDQPVLK
jgi:hypothetical protein